MNNEVNPENIPWYKQIMVWLVIMPPLAAVIGGIITINLAIESDDGLVEDDYYKQGLSINKTLERDRVAAQLGITAEMRVTSAMVDMTLSLPESSVYGGLLLHFIHPTRDKLDVTIELKPVSSAQFRGRIEHALTGNWNIILEPLDKTWRISGRVLLPSSEPMVLKPQI